MPTKIGWRSSGRRRSRGLVSRVDRPSLNANRLLAVTSDVTGRPCPRRPAVRGFLHAVDADSAAIMWSGLLGSTPKAAIWIGTTVPVVVGPSRVESAGDGRHVDRPASVDAGDLQQRRPTEQWNPQPVHTHALIEGRIARRARDNDVPMSAWFAVVAPRPHSRSGSIGREVQLLLPPPQSIHVGVCVGGRDTASRYPAPAWCRAGSFQFTPAPVRCTVPFRFSAAGTRVNVTPAGPVAGDRSFLEVPALATTTFGHVAPLSPDP